MRKIVILLALLSAPYFGHAQYRWDFGGGVGVSNYLGDIGGKDKTRRDFIYDLKVQKTRNTETFFARYKFRPAISFKTSLTHVTIEGDDSLSTNPARNQRNLSFRNNMFELTETVEYYFYKSSNVSGRPGLRGSRKKVDFRSYLFVGVGLLYSNPKAELNGSMVALQPLQTEGVKYSRFVPVVPVGLGLSYTINRNHRIGLEFGWRWTFSDYLDDISTVYVDPATLGSDNARTLANRNPETWPTVKDPVTSAANYGYEDFNKNTGKLNKRGDESNNDNYLSLLVTYSYVLKGKNKFYKSKYKSLQQRRKVVKRKTRAKF
jgi:hypothetical protein